MADLEAPRFVGELLLDWVDEAALNALAEQLDVNPPVETQTHQETGTNTKTTVKVTPPGIPFGLESSAELSRLAGKAQTFRSTSLEVRLRLVLDRLLHGAGCVTSWRRT